MWLWDGMLGKGAEVQVLRRPRGCTRNGTRVEDPEVGDNANVQ